MIDSCPVGVKCKWPPGVARGEGGAKERNPGKVESTEGLEEGSWIAINQRRMWQHSKTVKE